MVKIAQKDNVKEINLIRKEILLFHAKEENEYFKTDFNQEFQDYIYEFLNVFLLARKTGILLAI